MSDTFTWPCKFDTNWLLYFSKSHNNCIERDTTDYKWVKLLISSYLDSNAGFCLLDEAIDRQTINGDVPYRQEEKLSQRRQTSYPPVLAIALWQLIQKKGYQSHQEKAKFIELYHKVYQFHEFLYQHRDLASNGLLPISVSEARQIGPFYSPGQLDLETLMTKHHIDDRLTILDPFYNSLLCISNELLLKTGELLDQPLGDIICWHELTVHSINEYLWNEEACLYQPIEYRSGKPLMPNLINGLMPLVNGSATQRQAKLMCRTLMEVIENDGNRFLKKSMMDAWDIERRAFLRSGGWALVQSLLVAGLRNYGFEEVADKFEVQTKQGLKLLHQDTMPLEDGMLPIINFQSLEIPLIKKV